MSAVHPYAWHNGELVASTELHLSPFQTGLLSGWGLFSTLRIYQGVAFALEDHWERLGLDGACLHVATNGLWDEVQRGFAALIERNPAQEAVARIYLVRNRGGLLDQPHPRPTDLMIFTRSLREWGKTARLRLQPHGRHAQAPFAGTKTLTWAHNLALVEEANAAGFDDVLLLNERGEVAECTAANIFVARGGVLLTPPLDSGALPGVSRKVLLAAGPAHGLRLEEATLTPRDLEAAEEIFITSSTREVQAVERVGERAVPLGGPLTLRAAAAFHAAVEAYVAEHQRQPRAQPA
ncbi:MAG: aminotransferase class IV [Terriglobales bacterium]